MTLTFTLERHQDLIDTLNGQAKLHRPHAVAPMCFGLDVSHWQGPIDFNRVKAAGLVFVVMKATEGIGYIDGNLRTYRAQAHAAGLIVLFYHFCGSQVARQVYAPSAESSFFVRAIGSLAQGEGFALDYEPIAPPADPPSWSKEWLDTTRSVLGASPWIYMNSSTEARYNWSPVSAGYGLWLAKYDNTPAADPVVHWPNLTAEQYWDKGIVPGVPGPVDVDVYYGSVQQLLSMCKGGAPAPVTGGFLMALSDTEQAEVRDDIRFLADAVRGGTGPDNPTGDNNVSLIYWMLKGGRGGVRNNFNWTDDQAKLRTDAIIAEIGKVKAGTSPDATAVAAALAGNADFIAKLATAIGTDVATRLANG